MKSPKTPAPPDPVATAQAQSGMNLDTARTQQLVNMIDQVGPTGNLTYEQTGTTGFRDSSGKWVDIPQFTQTTSLTPGQQAIFDLNEQAETNLAGLAVDQSDAMRRLLNEPFQFNNYDAQNWAYDLGAQRLDPRFEQDESALRTRLINAGHMPGSAAWNAEMERFGQTKNDAYNQLMLQGRSQAFGEQLQQRIQPINEITALMSGTQVSTPTFAGTTPQTQVAGVDYTGLVNNQYQAQLAAANAKASQNNAMMGGLFGLGSAAIMASDMRVKEDIERVGTLYNGLPVYSFRYKSGGPVQIGLIAQEVELLHPDAVVEIDDVLHVDYSKAVL